MLRFINSYVLEQEIIGLHGQCKSKTILLRKKSLSDKEIGSTFEESETSGSTIRRGL